MIEKWFETFSLLQESTSVTGLGSTEISYTPVMTFSGAVSWQSGEERSAAGQLVLAETPVLLHEFDVTLTPNDHVRRERDGAVFRVTTATDSLRAPAFSGLRFAQVGVERVVYPC